MELPFIKIKMATKGVGWREGSGSHEFAVGHVKFEIHIRHSGRDVE